MKRAEQLVEIDLDDVVTSHAICPLGGTAPRGVERRQPIKLRWSSGHLSFEWGRPHEIDTAAYWTYLTARNATASRFNLGYDLRTELVACLLGGYGVPAEVGLCAYGRVLESGLIQDPQPCPEKIEQVLRQPLTVGTKSVRYRFPAQRAKRIAMALRSLRELGFSESLSPRVLRNKLVELPGVGPKTASWIVRNLTGSSEVAIIDIHIHRAGLQGGFFSPSWRLPRDYGLFEGSFLLVAKLGGVSAALLDAYMWEQLRQRPRTLCLAI